LQNKKNYKHQQEHAHKTWDKTKTRSQKKPKGGAAAQQAAIGI
jgi:hypothetical protein